MHHHIINHKHEDVYALYLDIASNGSREQCIAEGLFYRRNCPVLRRQRSIRRPRKRIAPITNGLLSEIKLERSQFRLKYDLAYI